MAHRDLSSMSFLYVRNKERQRNVGSLSTGVGEEILYL